MTPAISGIFIDVDSLRVSLSEAITAFLVSAEMRLFLEKLNANG